MMQGQRNVMLRGLFRHLFQTQYKATPDIHYFGPHLLQLCYCASLHLNGKTTVLDSWFRISARLLQLISRGSISRNGFVRDA
jgi:hypothetical protein